MKNLNIYQQLQFGIIIFLFFAWVVSTAICFFVEDPIGYVVTFNGKVEAIFFTLLALKSLEAAITRANGGPDEKADTPAG